jgi:hypothetical protein
MISGIWTFYKKLIVPVLSMSVLTGLIVYLNTGSATTAINLAGISCLFYTPMFQYFIYEIRNPQEYYFYYNMGISRLKLWLSTLAMILFIFLVILFL